MVLTQDTTLTQGDTKRLIIPVLDGDSADDEFLDDLAALTVEFALADDPGSEPLLETGDVTTEVVEFGDVKLGADAFEEVDEIPNDQDVVTVTLPAAATDTLAATGPGEALAYQVRLEGENIDEETERLTPVVGEITVEPAVIPPDGGGA